MKCKTVKTYTASIYIAGDITTIKQLCREFCERGLCVTIEPVDFVYTGGEESGARIGLINYPRFPSDPKTIFETAKELAEFLRAGLFQDSVSVVGKDNTLWITRRE